MKSKESLLETIVHGIFLILGLITVGCVLLITIYLVISGVPAIAKIGLFQFLFGTKWASTASEPSFGILPFIMTSIYGTAGAILLGVPVGFFTSVYLAKIASPKVRGVIETAVSLLAGIPSVVYGFFGLMIIVPWVRDTFRPYYGGNGLSLFSAALLLGIMILPTIISISESAIRAVPDKYYQGALALGATHERSVFRTVVPAAKSGIMAGIVLGIGRAFGETMAVIMIAGNQAWIPDNMFQGIRTLTANIVMEMGYAQDLHREALIATGVVLFVFILIINFSVALLKRRGEHE